MNRRGFLKMLGAAVPVVAAPALLAESTRSIFLPPKGGWIAGDFDTSTMVYRGYERYSQGWTSADGVFGSAPIKEEGAAIAYGDGVSLVSAAHPLSNRVGSNLLLTQQALFNKLQAGLRQLFEDAYRAHPSEWVKMYEDEVGFHVQPLNRDEVLIRPESLEQIELDLADPGTSPAHAGQMDGISRSIGRFSNTVDQAAELAGKSIDGMTREIQRDIDRITGLPAEWLKGK